MNTTAETTLKEISFNSHSQPGDYVVPHYNDIGGKVRAGKMYGDKQVISDRAQQIINSALSHGATLLPVVTDVGAKVVTKVKPKKVKATAIPVLKIDGFSTTDDEDRPKLSPAQFSYKPSAIVSDPIEVTFVTAHGKMKVSVEDILKIENALCLVFKDSKELRFEPPIGDTFELTTERGDKYKVMYPGFIFTWSDNVMKLMILVIDSDEE